jgi:glycosyltransferase involved in cell wall biosynthesis
VKKILFITSTFEKGGLTNVVYDLVKNIDKSVFDVSVLTLSPEPERSRLADFEKIPDVKLLSLRLSRVSGMLKGKSKTQKLVDEIKPDIIHSHGIRANGIVSKLKTCALKVATVHSFLKEDYSMTYGRLKGGLMCAADISSLKKMSVCVGVSQSVAFYLNERFGLKNAIGIPNGVDTERFSPVSEEKKVILREKLSMPQDKKIVLFTGSLSDIKNPAFLIEQWRFAAGLFSEYHLYIIGTGKQYKECVNAAAGSENIHVVGQKDNAEEYLQAGDFYVSASKSEGISLSVLEAAACGLPLLLTDIPPFEEVLSYNENMGRRYREGDGKNFIETFMELAKADKEVLRNAAVETMRKDFSVEKMIERYQKVYSEGPIWKIAK